MLKLLHAIADPPRHTSESVAIEAVSTSVGTNSAIRKRVKPSPGDRYTPDSDIFSTPGNRSRKHPRCSPNPFRAFRHRRSSSISSSEGSPSPSPIPIPNPSERRSKQDTECGDVSSQQAVALDVVMNDVMGSPFISKACLDGDGIMVSPILLDDLDGDRAERVSCTSLSPRVGGSSAFGTGVVEEEQRVKDDKDEELARRLLFLVSHNTGRIHVYEERETDAGGLDDDFEEENKPRHCRWDKANKSALPNSLNSKDPFGGGCLT